MKLIRLTFLLLAWPVGFLAAQEVRPSPSSLPVGPAYDLLQRMVRDGPVTNWWGRPPAELRVAADRGEGDAILALAQQLLAGPDGPNQLDEAKRLIALAAERKQSQAQYLMGYLAMNQRPAIPGGEVLQDVESAFDWFELSAAGGSLRACWEIGNLYNYGKLPRNYAEAERWYQKAADRGHVPSMEALAEMFRSNHPNADGTLFRSDSAKVEKWEAALRARKGPPTVRPRSPRNDLLARAASILDARGLALFTAAISNAVALDDGAGVRQRESSPPRHGDKSILTQAQEREILARTPADFEWALNFYGEVPFSFITEEARAAAAGLLRLYSSGRLNPNHQDLRPLLPLDPELFPEPAQRLQVADLLAQGNPFLAADPENAVRWYLALARDGNPTAMRRIGKLWQDGTAGTPDDVEAKKWFERAEAAEAVKP